MMSLVKDVIGDDALMECDDVISDDVISDDVIGGVMMSLVV